MKKSVLCLAPCLVGWVCLGVAALAQPAGFPNANTTGLTVPKSSLKPYVHTIWDKPVTYGYSILKTPGRVIENQRIHGLLYLCADNITIRNCWITADAQTKPCLIQVKASNYPQSGGTYPKNILIEHCEVGDAALPSGNRGIGGGNLTVRYCHIHHGEDGGVLASNAVWEYNYIHDLSGYVGNPDPHSDGLQAQDAVSRIIIRHNTIMRNLNSAVILKTDFGNISDVLIQQNYLAGGNYTVYSRKGPGYPAPTNVRLIDNVFGRNARFGLISADGAIVNQGNVWEDTRTLIPGSSPSPVSGDRVPLASRPGPALCYPNPVYGSACFTAGRLHHFTSLTICNSLGQVVAVLEAGPGTLEMEWNGADAQGRPLPPGSYYYCLTGPWGNKGGTIIKLAGK